jgi:hypothetical protein
MFLNVVSSVTTLWTDMFNFETLYFFYRVYAFLTILKIYSDHYYSIKWFVFIMQSDSVLREVETNF